MVTGRPTRLLDVATLAEEYGPSKAFWREVVAKGLLPVIRPPEFRRVLVERTAVDRLLASWTEVDGLRATDD